MALSKPGCPSGRVRRINLFAPVGGRLNRQSGSSPLFRSIELSPFKNLFRCLTLRTTKRRCFFSGSAVFVMAMLSGAGVASATTSIEAVDPTHFRVCADPGNLPYSNEKREGFENKIAELLAKQLNRPLIYAWCAARSRLYHHHAERQGLRCRHRHSGRRGFRSQHQSLLPDELCDGLSQGFRHQGDLHHRSGDEEAQDRRRRRDRD